MGLFDFLEHRLEEFLQNNPHLELQALEEQVNEQKQDTIKLISQLELTEKRQQNEIMSVAKEIQTWHSRVSKAKQAGRLDLANAAQEREASLLRQGNQLWGQMEATKQQLVQAQELLVKVEQRQKEIQLKKQQVQSTQAQPSTSSWDTTGWNQGSSYNPNPVYDDLDAQFQQWEMDEEIARMKRNRGQ